MNSLNVFVAFGAGILSFISPCCLPLYPAFLSYITGVSVQDLKSGQNKFNKIALLHTFCFVIGFSSIFIVLGLSTTYLYRLFFEYSDLIRQFVAVLLLFFGLVMVGILKPRFLMADRRLTFKNRPSGYLGTTLIGVGYAAGWTPCVGPILGTVMSLGLYTGQGFLYMCAYALGFSLPFIIMSFFIGKAGWIKKYASRIAKMSGYLTITMSLILFFDWMTNITAFLTTHLFRGFTGF
ncbi:cytochrome c biogenesis protein CcdA [Priestia aryabhattai]|uniref:cytochrome c biogenesis CcdA family protein n=1 Tax=Priestia aryabhattai TaxID=412384 RepID=UPI00203CAFE7|nr:cytochrome c biogenesis protein CcdA [Priestia aryabhattai]MCM3769582.1 cytochrome c biogenesis protein CcdA [Priestia aryabhattai]